MTTIRESFEKSGLDTQHETINKDEYLDATGNGVDSRQRVQMRSELDDLPVLQAYRIYWRITLICMLGAFSAALEGYRKSHFKYAAAEATIDMFVS